MSFRVFKSEDGRIAVRSKEENFVASFDKGKWVAELVFDAYELEELRQVTDPKEAQAIYSEAKKALECGSEVA